MRNWLVLRIIFVLATSFVYLSFLFFIVSDLTNRFVVAFSVSVRRIGLTPESGQFMVHREHVLRLLVNIVAIIRMSPSSFSSGFSKVLHILVFDYSSAELATNFQKHATIFVFLTVSGFLIYEQFKQLATALFA